MGEFPKLVTVILCVNSLGLGREITSCLGLMSSRASAVPETMILRSACFGLLVLRFTDPESRPSLYGGLA